MQFVTEVVFAFQASLKGILQHAINAFTPFFVPGSTAKAVVIACTERRCVICSSKQIRFQFLLCFCCGFL